jgi:pyruvate,water dikinase
MAPGLVKPLVYSVNVLAIGTQVFGRLFTELIGPTDMDYTALVPRIHSRVYGDMTLMGDLFARAGLPPNMIEMMYQEERTRRSGMGMAMLRPMPYVARFAARHRDLAQCAAREIAQRDAELAAYRSADWSTAPAGVLIAELDRLIALRNDFYWLFFLVTMSMVLRTGALSRWARSRAPDVPFGDLVRGLSGLKGLEPMAEIGRLAALARALPPDAQALLLEADEAAIRRQLSADAAGRDLIAQVDIFLRDYGYLSGNGSDFSAPAWDERPALIWRAVGRAALLPPPDSSADAAAIREEALHRVRARLHPTVCPAFNRLFASTLVYVALRERVSLLMSEYSYQVRRLVLALAARLVAAGDLTAADDIFYLTYDELRALAAGELAAGAARAQITTRTAEMVADAQIEPPEVIRGDPARLHVAPQPIEAASAYLSGIGGSAGVAHGRARVVRDPADAPPWLDRKDILVVPYSDVGWTPLFSSVGGIVAETGGQLSHTAIVAREYGLPAVVSVKGATRLIRDGQALTVDGNCGRVYLSADQPAAAS